MICRTCRYKAIKLNPAPANFILHGCRKRKLLFGTSVDWKAGKWLGESAHKKEFGVSDMPKECKYCERR